MKQKDKSRSRQNKLNSILRSGNSGSKIVIKYFNDLSAPEIKRYAHLIYGHRHFIKSFKLSLLGDCLTFYSKMTPDVDLDKNVSWCIGVALNNFSEIRYFLEHQDLLTSAILNSQFDQAHCILDSIDIKCGISMWSVSIRGSLYALSDNYEGQLAFFNGLVERAGSNNFFKGVAHNSFNRYEEGSTYLANASAFKSQLKRLFREDLLNFLMYRLVLNDINFPYNYNHIINIEKNSSVIDVFNCLIDFSLFALHPKNKHLSDLGHNILSDLSVKFDDVYLFGIANCYDIPSKWNFYSDEFECLDNYTKGNYSEIKSIFDNNSSLGLKFSLFEIAAKASTRSCTFSFSGLQQKLLESMVSVLVKDQNYELSVASLYNYCHCFYGLKWFKELYFILLRYTSFLNEEDYLYACNLSSALSGVDSPLKSRIMNDKTRSLYLSKCGEVIGTSITLDLFTYNATDTLELDSNIDTLRLNKYKAKKLLDNGNYAAAIELLAKLAASSDILLSHEAITMLISAYLKNGELQKAIAVYVENVLVNAYLLLCFNIKQLCDIAKSLIETSDCIMIPILLSFHSRYVDDEYDAALKYSFEKFLQNNSLTSPLELLLRQKDFPDNALYYYLEYICTPDVMKLYLYFDSTKDIETCRIDICKYLIEVGRSKDKLVEEVKDRTKKLVLRDAVKQVENSRIYADTTALISSGTNKYSQLYDKFASIRVKDYSTCEDEILLNKLYLALKIKDLLAGSHTVHLIDCQLNEKNATFLNLIKRIRDEFTLGERGLNSHLSTRIRHGHLPTTLRKCVVDENLFVSKFDRDDRSTVNNYWKGKLEIINDDEIHKLHKTFAEFSKKYELFIEEVNDSWLQIVTLDQDLTNLAKDSKKIRGLFNYSVTALEAYSIQQRLPDTADYNDFLKIAIEWLWARTEQNLVTVRSKISGEVRERIYGLLDHLQKDLIAIVGDAGKIPELNNAIGRARAMLNISIEQILVWFTRTELNLIETFEFDTVSEIAAKSLDVDIILAKHVNYTFRGGALNYLVDVLYILYENAISKSFISKPELKITVDIGSDESGAAILTVKNNCKHIDDIENANRNIDYYRKSYGKDEITDKSVQGEGGTGFFKINKILSKYMEINNSIEFGFIDHDSFYVELRLLNIERIIQCVS